jgi:hypothetical protein
MSLSGHSEPVPKGFDGYLISSSGNGCPQVRLFPSASEVRVVRSATAQRLELEMNRAATAAGRIRHEADAKAKV